MSFRPSLRIAFGACLFAVISVPACSNQGEGEICDPSAGNGGNDDCQSGLVCKASPLPGVQGARCCPPEGVQATTAVCAATPEMADANPAPPPADAGVVDAPSMDATGDAPPESAPATDAPAASPEATAPDAPADVGPGSATDAPAEGTVSDGGAG